MSAKFQRDNRTLVWLNREIDSLMRRMYDLLNKGEEEQFVELPLDIYETGDSLVVVMDIPGITEGDINIFVEGQWIVIEGQKEDPRDDIEGKLLYHRIERRFGRFLRKINVPEPFSPDHAKAEIRKGTLVLTIPARERVPHRITITKEKEEQND